MRRWLYLLYGIGCHLLFLATFAWMIGFVGNLLVPHSIDSPATSPWPLAVVINLGLMSLFAVQHSAMARPAFKQWWVRFVPRPIERSTYVLLSCGVVALLMWLWQPINAIVWDVRSPAARAGLWFLFQIGWLMVPLVSLLINHFDLFGTRQVWLYFRGQEYTPLEFRVPSLYRWVRHPLYIGWAIAFWAIPTMTVGHLLFAGTLTLYMGLAALVEERDLIAHFGQQYEDYRRRVPMFLPSLGRAPLDQPSAQPTLEPPIPAIREECPT